MSLVYKILIVAALILGFTAAAAIGVLYNTYIDNPIVRRMAKVEGAAEERAEWEKLIRIAKVQQDLRVSELQKKINEADQALQLYRVNERRRGESIRRAYEERSKNGDTGQKPGCDYSQCTLPDWVRKELQ